MKIDQWVSLSVRLFAIFMFFTVVYNIGIVLINMIVEPGSLVMLAGTAAVFILLIAASAAMWHHPERIAERIVPKDMGQVVTSALDAGKVEKLAFALLGLWIVIWAGTDLVRDLFVYWKHSTVAAVPNSIWMVRAEGAALADGVKLLLGLIVLAKGLGCGRCCKSKCC